MKRVTVVGTRHEEAVLATAAALMEIVQRLRPEVVFLECPPAYLERFVSEDAPSIEALVARTLRQSGRVALVPVDLPTPDAQFFYEHRQLCERVEARSRDYCNAVDAHAVLARAGGFPYLNSDYCDALWQKMDDEVAEAVVFLRDPQLAEYHSRWTGMNEARESAWVSAVEQYLSESEATRAVLLVGAAHRRSLRRKAKVTQEAGAGNVLWDFPDGQHLVIASDR